MHVPLPIRLLGLVALAWRLILIARKPNPLVLKPAINLDSLSKFEAVYLGLNNLSIGSLKNIYRDKVRGQETDSQENMLIYLFICIEKEYRKAGIFRFLWFQPAYALAFYQSLLKTKYTEAQLAFKEILKTINPSVFDAFENENHIPQSDDFIPDGNMSKDLTEAFDRIFDLEIYLKKINIYVVQA